MPIDCNILLKPSATSEQLTAIGISLWQWCIHTGRRTGIYQFLDNQALADLIAGKLPELSQTDHGSVSVWVRDEESEDPHATLESLRRQVPAAGIENILISGASREKNGAPRVAVVDDDPEQDWWPSRASNMNAHPTEGLK